MWLMVWPSARAVAGISPNPQISPIYADRFCASPRGRAPTTARPPSISASRRSKAISTPTASAQRPSSAAFLAVLFAYALMALYQGQVSPALGYRKPSTIRAAVFPAGPSSRAGHKRLLRFSQAWGGILKHKALIDAALHKPLPIAPLLAPCQLRAASSSPVCNFSYATSRHFAAQSRFSG
jgi:hypothetical protein